MDRQQLPSDYLQAGWCQDALAVNADGIPVAPEDPSATMWDLEGAVRAAFQTSNETLRRYMMRLNVHLEDIPMVIWNGQDHRTKEEVVRLCLLVEYELGLRTVPREVELR